MRCPVSGSTQLVGGVALVSDASAPNARKPGSGMHRISEVKASGTKILEFTIARKDVLEALRVSFICGQEGRVACSVFRDSVLGRSAGSGH